MFNFKLILQQRKCDRYWPKEDSETYGNIEVTLLKEESMANYSVRSLKIKHLKVRLILDFKVCFITFFFKGFMVLSIKKFHVINVGF